VPSQHWAGLHKRPNTMVSDIRVFADLLPHRRDPDAWTFNDGRPYYTQTAPVPADPDLSALLVGCCTELVGRERVQEGLNATADSFYSSQVKQECIKLSLRWPKLLHAPCPICQAICKPACKQWMAACVAGSSPARSWHWSHLQGRIAGSFNDHNDDLLDALLSQHPALLSLEMETFQLLDLARCSGGTIKAAAFCIAAAERHSNRWAQGWRRGGAPSAASCCSGRRGMWYRLSLCFRRG
jgi:hypothetical protein